MRFLKSFPAKGHDTRNSAGLWSNWCGDTSCLTPLAFEKAEISGTIKIFGKQTFHGSPVCKCLSARWSVNSAPACCCPRRDSYAAFRFLWSAYRPDRPRCYRSRWTNQVVKPIERTEDKGQSLIVEDQRNTRLIPSTDHFRTIQGNNFSTFANRFNISRISKHSIRYHTAPERKSRDDSPHMLFAVRFHLIRELQFHRSYSQKISIKTFLNPRNEN